MLETRDLIFPISGDPFTITEGDGYAYRILLKKGKKIFDVISDYLASLTVTIGALSKVNREHILDLLSPDQVFLAVECYKLNYGDTFDFEHSCASCGETSPQSFLLTSLDLRPLPSNVEGRDPTIDFVLPRTKKQASIGLLTARKEMQLVQQMLSTGADLNQSDFLALRSLDGSAEFSYEDVIRLPLADHKAIRSQRKKLICGYDTEIRVTCDYCGDISLVNVLMHRDFLLPAG